MFGQGSYQIFFSTHILTRRMTPHFFLIIFLCIFQLTSSQGGWQCTIIATKGWYRLFNSHPHKEDDQFLTWPLVLRLFSTHILTRRMTSSRLDTLEQLAFQLTSSQGGWLVSFWNTIIILIFQLTSSQGGWLSPTFFKVKLFTFQLTSSQGGWP